MINIIVAVSKQSNGKLGIGLGNTMAWKCLEELSLFKEKTMGNVLIMGRSTAENIPKLSGREIYCLSRTHNKFIRVVTIGKNKVRMFNNVNDAIRDAREIHPNKKLFIAGGEQLYRVIMSQYIEDINEIHISYIKDAHRCDKFFDFIPNHQNCICLSHSNHNEFTSYVLSPNKNTLNRGESEYLSTLERITKQGELRDSRNGKVNSNFSTEHLLFNLENDAFPLLTTKKMFFRGIVEELLFFIRGETNSKLLEEKGIKIWKGNTSREFLDKKGFDYKEGEMGPMYGYQWRCFNGELDQLQKVIDQIKNDPYSRRILLTDYNPLQAEKGVLYPCHSIIIQFYVSKDIYLDMKVFNRSSDCFLGLPFNIASSSLLLMLIAKMCDLTPRNIYIDLGDAHIYEQHLNQVKEQCSRFPYKFPKLKIEKDLSNISDIENLEFKDFIIEDYSHYPSIKGKMIA